MTEVELEALNFPDAAKMVSAAFPGPKAAEALALSDAHGINGVWR